MCQQESYYFANFCCERSGAVAGFFTRPKPLELWELHLATLILARIQLARRTIRLDAADEPEADEEEALRQDEEAVARTLRLIERDEAQEREDIAQGSQPIPYKDEEEEDRADERQEHQDEADEDKGQEDQADDGSAPDP